MDSDQRVYILLLALVWKIPVFYLGSKILQSRTHVLAKLQPADRGWNQLKLSSIAPFSMDLKRIQTPHTLYSGISEQVKPLQLFGQAAELKFESKFEPLLVIWQSLPKAIPEDDRRFWLRIQWQSSWGSAPAQLG